MSGNWSRILRQNGHFRAWPEAQYRGSSSSTSHGKGLRVFRAPCCPVRNPRWEALQMRCLAGLEHLCLDWRRTGFCQDYPRSSSILGVVCASDSLIGLGDSGCWRTSGLISWCCLVRWLWKRNRDPFVPSRRRSQPCGRLTYPSFARWLVFLSYDKTVRVKESTLVERTIHLRCLVCCTSVQSRLSFQVEEKQMLMGYDQCSWDPSENSCSWRAVIRFQVDILSIFRKSKESVYMVAKLCGLIASESIQQIIQTLISFFSLPFFPQCHQRDVIGIRKIILVKHATLFCTLHWIEALPARNSIHPITEFHPGGSPMEHGPDHTRWQRS